MEKLVFYPGNKSFNFEVYKTAGLSYLSDQIGSVDLGKAKLAEHLLLQSCESCAGTLGTVGTAFGTFGSFGTYGSYGCGD